MIKINQLSKQFGSLVAVNNIKLEINEPGLYIFVGANGSGKTTLFNLINGLILPSSGEIVFNNTAKGNKIEAFTGISTEPFKTEPYLTVEGIAEISRFIKKVPKSEIEKWLSFWGLQQAKQKMFKNLSTGMKKRLSLALSLFGNPNLIFWDEPFNGLDPLGIEILIQLISKLLHQEKYIFLSTHLLNEISTVEATYFVMHEGKIIGTVHKNSKNKKTTILKLLKQI